MELAGAVLLNLPQLRVRIPGLHRVLLALSLSLLSLEGDENQGWGRPRGKWVRLRARTRWLLV